MVLCGRRVCCTLTTSLSTARLLQLNWTRCVPYSQGSEKEGPKVSPKKCHLFKKRVVFLGHVVSEDGLSADPEKIRAVCDWPTPVSASTLCSFLGLCFYYRRFVCCFADTAVPLHRLTEKDKAFSWTKENDDALQRLKQVLSQASVLAQPTSEGKFVLDTDASNTGIGAVLS